MTVCVLTKMCVCSPFAKLISVWNFIRNSNIIIMEGGGGGASPDSRAMAVLGCPHMCNYTLTICEIDFSVELHSYFKYHNYGGRGASLLILGHLS